MSLFSNLSCYDDCEKHEGHLFLRSDKAVVITTVAYYQQDLTNIGMHDMLYLLFLFICLMSFQLKFKSRYHVCINIEDNLLKVLSIINVMFVNV